MPSKKIIAEDGKAAIKNKYYIACGIIKYLFEYKQKTVPKY